MPIKRGRWIAAVAILLPLLIVVIVYFGSPFLHVRHEGETYAPPKPAAPPDLAKLRNTFTAALDALRHKRGDEAARLFASFNFGSRAVEEYRLYFLGKARQLAKDAPGARVALATLWLRDPKMVARDDAGLTLGSIYADGGDFRRAAETFVETGVHARGSDAGGNARWNALTARIADGDAGGALFIARKLVIKTPRAGETADAIAIVRTFTGIAKDRPLVLTPAERLERAVGFLRDGDPQNAIDEMDALGSSVPADLRLPLQLNRGLALNQLRRYDDSNKLLEPLASGPYRFAVPAIYTASKNYRALSASINPITFKTVMVRQRVGTVRVGKGKHAKVRPKYARVKKTTQLVDLAKKAKKDEYERLATERLKDLLHLPLADDVRVEVLGTLIARAEAKNEDDYERQLIPELANLDPSQEAGLQHFWDKAWTAYASGDLKDAIPLLLFVRDNYRNPNVKRQAEYWYARSIERLGRKEEAQALYRSIASSAYEDVYAKFAESRGAPHQVPTNNPLTMNRPDWRDIAEHAMPGELRLAYELTALADASDARAEIQQNRTRKNEQFANALLADLFNSSGDMLNMMRTLRAAFPAVATVEQDSVPPYFLKMYYPIRYQDAIRKYSRKNGLDPHLVMGLIHQESYFNPRTRSAPGAIGLMQLMPATGRELGSRLFRSFDVARLQDPNVNIELGTMHFRYLLDLFGGKVELAVASYNAGQGNVMKWRRAAPGKPMDEFLESIPFAETRNYVKRVTMLAASYSRIAD